MIQFKTFQMNENVHKYKFKNFTSTDYCKQGWSYAQNKRMPE